ncbi:MAG: GNAT family N-acetyltransferase [Anaerolineales bacterium]|nr:GNAT family N-acetyltransferase [Anaerolineales bacterium]
MKKKLADLYSTRMAGMEDLPQIHRLEEKKSLHYHGVPGLSLERLKNEYEIPGFDINKSVHLVENQEENLVGLVEVWDETNPPVHPYVWFSVDPDLENQGIEDYLIAWAEERCLQVLDRVDPDLRVAIRSHSDHSVESSRNAKLAAGMKYIRHSFRMRIEMEQEPPVPVWPEGITMRMYNPEKDARMVYEVDEEVFQDHFGYIKEPPEEGFEKFMHHMTGDDSYDPTLWFLAVDNEEIVGICICRSYGAEDKDTGFISSLGVKRPWRRQGIALALLQQAFGEYYQRGKRKVDLGVDAESLTGATDLYQKAGMFVLRQFDMYEKELRSGKNVSVTTLETSGV